MRERETTDKCADIFIFLADLTVIGLKIGGIITIPWVWLLAPIWVTFLVGLVIACIVLLLFLGSCVIDKIEIISETHLAEQGRVASSFLFTQNIFIKIYYLKNIILLKKLIN